MLIVTPVLSKLNQDSAAAFVRWLWRELAPDNVALLLVRQSPRAGAALKDVAPARYVEAQRAALEPLRRGRLFLFRR